MYSVVLSTRQMFAFSSKDPVLVRNHSFFHNIKLLINMCTMRDPLILNLEIQSSSGIILCSYQISFFRASQYYITMIIYLPAFLVGRATITSPPRKKGNWGTDHWLDFPALCLLTSCSSRSSLHAINTPSSLLKGRTYVVFSMELHNFLEWANGGLLKACSVFQLVCPIWPARTGIGALTSQSDRAADEDRLISILGLTEMLRKSLCSYVFLLFSPISTILSHTSRKGSTFLAFLWQFYYCPSQ